MRQCLLELTAQPWNSRVQHSQALIELAEQAIASNPNRATEDVIAHPVMAPPGETAFYTRVVATCRAIRASFWYSLPCRASSYMHNSG
jgi:hypothetical protein